MLGLVYIQTIQKENRAAEAGRIPILNGEQGRDGSECLFEST